MPGQLNFFSCSDHSDPWMMCWHLTTSLLVLWLLRLQDVGSFLCRCGVSSFYLSLICGFMRLLLETHTMANSQAQRNECD